MEKNYDFLLNTFSKDQWERIGTHRRSGVVAPLFSIHSSKSLGLGELFDLNLLIDWCTATGMSIIQLLPMNDVGFNFRPYDAQSTFALDPMFLSLYELDNVDTDPFKEEFKKIKINFPTGTKRVDYRIKAAKLGLLWKIFQTNEPQHIPAFEIFMHDNAYWLEDYALFKVIKEKNNEMAWEGWSEDLKHKNAETICSFKETYSDHIIFQKWLQWQLSEQFKKVKVYAGGKNVLLMGDLPFLVSRDSADVWAHQDYFKLTLSSGAPPDMLYSHGQRWGMPPYQWDNIARNDFDYLIEKLKYAQNFYDLFRIDHVVGTFRVWTISLSESLENGGLNGVFEPKDDKLWEEHGRNILSVMVKNTDMLACAEDLGVVPPCSYKVLEELGIPGIDIQRWMRDWGKNFDFKEPGEYRRNALATIATHDMSNLCAWWEFEAGTVDEGLFRRKCREKGINFDVIKDKLFDPQKSFHGRLRWKQEVESVNTFLKILGTDETTSKDWIDLYKGSFGEKAKFLKLLGISQEIQDGCPSVFVKMALEKVSQSASIFSCQLLQDWLSLDSLFDEDTWELRINFPGTLSDKNWSLVMPLSLEDMLTLPVNSVIKAINEQSGRIV